MPKSKSQPSLTRERKIVKKDITKEEFLANLGKVCQPISKEPSESDSKKTETQAFRLYDGYIGMNTH